MTLRAVCRLYSVYHNNDSLNKSAVDNFCKYLRIKTVQPNPDYRPAVEFLKTQATQLDLDFDVVHLEKDNPIVFLKWKGNNTTLKSVVLNSHMDVVPVFLDQWKYDPFSAHIDEEGNIYARGSQDMKCVGIQYLEAIRRIKLSKPNYTPERDIYVMFVPDEELGGFKGMCKLVADDLFTKMNIGVVMDEGLANPTDEYSVYYGDRVVWWIKVHIKGNTGHGSQFIGNCAGLKLRTIIDKFMDFRSVEEERMIRDGLTLGEVTTVNLTGVTGGVQHNVVPSPFTVDFDVRITPSTDLKLFRTMIDDWAKDAGTDIEYEFIQHDDAAHLTCIDSSNPWWVCFENVCKTLDMKILPQIFPAGTDSRFIREKGIPAIGFSPMNRTPILLHDHNEFLNKDIFINGVSFYERLIPALAAVQDNSGQ